MLRDIRNYLKFCTAPKQKFIEGLLVKPKATIQIAILKNILTQCNLLVCYFHIYLLRDEGKEILENFGVFVPKPFCFYNRTLWRVTTLLLAAHSNLVFEPWCLKQLSLLLYSKRINLVCMLYVQIQSLRDIAGCRLGTCFSNTQIYYW